MAYPPQTKNEGTISVQTMSDEELLTKYSEVVSTIARNGSVRGVALLLNVYRQEILRRMNHKPGTPQLG